MIWIDSHSSGGEWLHKEFWEVFYSFPYLRRFPGFWFHCLSHAMASYQDASWRLHCHILLFSSLYDGPVLHNSQVRELVNTVFKCHHQGSLRADAHHCCIYSAGWGIKKLFLNLEFWNLLLRCWSYLGLPLSSPVFPCPLGMFLSITWSGTLQKTTGVTLVRCNAKMC